MGKSPLCTSRTSSPPTGRRSASSSSRRRRREGVEELFATIARLQALQPSFVSVTYGAGGSTRERRTTWSSASSETNLDRRLAPDLRLPHEQELAASSTATPSRGIENILALGGDPPRDWPNYDRSHDAFRYAADLVRFIRRRRTTAPDPRGLRHRRRRLPRGPPRHARTGSRRWTT